MTVRSDEQVSGIVARNHVHVSGAGTAPMLFAHGFGCDQTMWRFLVPEFEADHEVVLFDYVGSGRADPRSFDAGRYATLDGYADDVLEICLALDLRDVVFVGHSVSSMIGVLAAIREPARFRRLILVAPSPRYLNDPPHYAGGFEREEMEELFDLMDRNYIGWASMMGATVMGNADRPELREELSASFCSTDPRYARRFAETTFFADNRDDLARVSVPALILQCSDDPIAPRAVGQFVHEQMRGSTFRLMEATGHCPQLSDPQETVRAIREYLGAGAQS
jgi:sigma-B regulation protein RsbQ